MIKSNEYNMLEDYIYNNVIKTHRTKTEAQKYASSIGWQQYHIERIQRRFETVWIVAQHFIQPDEYAGLSFDTYIAPTGQYEYKNGTNQMITVRFKKLIN